MFQYKRKDIKCTLIIKNAKTVRIVHSNEQVKKFGTKIETFAVNKNILLANEEAIRN